jgi:tetratricopeptide (TPR) repeat protein
LAAADAHVRNGWTLAEQAEHNGLRASLLSARSKNEFLRRHYSEAARLARRGYEFNQPGTVGVLLACQEADALQAIGRIDDAREALARSERQQDATSQGDEFGGIFGCGIARQANYSISTYLRAGLVDQALRHVERAELAWRNGEEWAYGTWAQVQIGAAIAFLLKGEIEAAVTVMQRVLDQPEEQRLATLTTRMRRDVSPLLADPAIRSNKFAIMLREGIENYNKVPIRSLPAGGELWAQSVRPII